MEPRTFELEFAKFIQRFSDQIRDAFLEDALDKREMLSHYQLGRHMLQEFATGILSEFVVNIDKRTPVENVADRYVQMGMKCVEDGLSFSEMSRVFILLKRHIWLFFQDNNFGGQPFDVRSIIALNNRITLFFDRAIYYFLVGFEQGLSDEETELDQLYHTFLGRVKRDLGLNTPRE